MSSGLFVGANVSDVALSTIRADDLTSRRYEYKFIDCISKDILKKLCDGPLHVGENLVGIDFHFDRLGLSRFIGSHKVNMIGICGISGIGKTTLAKAIYNLVYAHFEGSCFCEDVKEVEEKQSLTQVQMQMIGKILKTDDLTISSVGEGSMVIKQRMACKRILLVLDDVNNVEQLEALAGSRDWFYPGSFIIFTGKDKQLLRSHNVDGIYDMENLDDHKALELFSLYAFGKLEPLEDFKELASQVLIHLQGHPLALKVFGRLLYDKSEYFWKSELDRLQTYPNSDILKKLRPSFNSLASDQKRMFLDIACLFVGENSDSVVSILDECNFFADTNMQVLVDKSLITIRSDMSLQMHVLIKAMAREIIYEESIMTGKQRRLSFGGQGRIQPRWWTSITAPFGLLSKQQHPQTSVPLEGLHMLKKLNLSYCNLEQVPESIGGLSCLKELYLNGNNLLEVPESIVGLSCLQLLYLKGNNFTSLPGNLSQLSHLRDLCVDGCKKLEVLPKLPPSLRVINASDCTSLREVAESYKDPIRYNGFINCPKLLKNVTIDSEGSISKTLCLDSTITSQGFIHQLSAIIGYFGFPTNRCEFFLQDTGFYSLNIVYPGNSIREWFTNRSKGKHVKVELPSYWRYDNFRGYGTCVVFKRKKPHKLRGYSLKNFDGASLNPTIYNPFGIRDYFENEVIGIEDSYLIWLHYTKKWEDWKEAKNFVTFCFEAIEVKECGVRLICDEDLQQQEDVTNLMFQDLPTLSQHGGAISYYGPFGEIHWSC